MNSVCNLFPGGKTKAVTMSYDDGPVYDRQLVEIFNRFGIRGTFHLNSGRLNSSWCVSASEVSELYRGHEVACHSVSHPMLDRCAMPSVIHEIMDDRIALEKLVGYPVRGLSYPYGKFNRQILDLLPLCGIRYSRAVRVTEGFDLPEHPLNWEGTCHHNHPRLMELAQQLIDREADYHLSLMYVWGHSYEFNNDNNWDRIEKFCELIGGRDDIWYCTNIELIDCIDRFRGLRFAADMSFVSNPSAEECWISLNGSPLRIPGGAFVRL